MLTTFKALMTGALRDRISLFYATLFPLVILIGLGIAFPAPAYRHQLLISLVAMGSLFFAMNGTAFEVLKQRNKGVYKLLRATPFQIPAFVFALTAVRTLMALACSVVTMLVGMLIFRVAIPVSSLLLMLPTLAVGTLLFTFLGFLVGNLATNEGNVNLIANLLTLPIFFASDAFYSLSKAPAAVQALSRFMPITYFLKAVQAANLIRPADMLQPLLILVGMAAVGLLMAVVTFRWDPDAGLRLPFRSHASAR